MIKKVSNYSLLKNIPHKVLFFCGILLSIFGAFAELILPQFVSNLSDVKVLNFLLHNLMYLLFTILFFVCIYLLQGAATYILGCVGADTIKKLQSIFVKHTLNLTVSELEKHPAGDIASRLTNDISEVAKIVTVIIPQFVIHFIMIVGSIIILFIINYRLAALLLLCLILILAFTFPVNKYIENLYTIHQSYLGDINHVYSQKIRSIRIVKSFLGNEQENKMFSSKFNGFAHNLTRTALVLTIMNTVINGMMMFLVLGVVILAGWQVSKGIMTFKMLVAFILYVVQLINPSMEFITNLSELSESLGALKRVKAVFNLPEELLNDGNDDFVIKNGKIEFNNVSFSYNTKEKILNNVNLTIDPRSFVAIVGPSGVGKSTIFSLLMKFYNDFSGEIKIDGQSIKKISAISLRKQCSYVFQENDLFSGTIKDNLIYGKNHNATETDLTDALEISGAISFINNLPDGINTDLGVDGKCLSEGQRQRLNISRALVSKPKIILLDEITASLDSVSEDQITKSFKKIGKRSTIVVIAHRLNTIIDADKIFVLDNKGHISDFGTHEKLLQTSSLYRKMFENSRF